MWDSTRELSSVNALFGRCCNPGPSAWKLHIDINKKRENGGNMPINASIILDSGSFMSPGQGIWYPSCRVGYFQCEASCPDVRIYADGEEVNVGHDLKFGDGKKTVDVIHVNANGQGIVGVTK